MEKLLLRLDLVEHKGQERIFAYCNYDSAINKILREIPGAKFSATTRSWHFPPVKELVEMLKEKIKDLAEIDVQMEIPLKLTTPFRFKLTSDSAGN
jgi:hypothetical protein